MQKLGRQKPYLEKVQEAIPRVLSLLDREPISKTFGSSDRLFWCWKFIDFSGARFQELAYTLAHIDKTYNFDDCVIDKRLLDSWISGVFEFWAREQNKDGSFDEAYPLERSLAATAFTGFYLGQAYLKLKKSNRENNFSTYLPVFIRLADWLCENEEHHGFLSNHISAAAAALHTVYEISGNKKYLDRSNYFVKMILSHQSDEGWYEEYGGADVGYQSHTTFYLSHIFSKTKDPVLLDSLRRSTKYFSYFVHPDGSIGGEYASRNTRFFFPAGFEILATYDDAAASIAAFMRKSILENRSVNLLHMDAQNIMPMLNNYIYIVSNIEQSAVKSVIKLPHSLEFSIHFPNSGHLIVSKNNYYAVLCAGKGGVLYACSKSEKKKTIVDSGVAIQLRNGNVFSTQGLNCSEVQKFDGRTICIQSQFSLINQVTQSSLKFFILRAIAKSSWVHPILSIWLKRTLVLLLVNRRKRLDENTTRCITFNKNAITLVDKFFPKLPHNVVKVFCGGRFSVIHMGSSRYFEWSELISQNHVQISKLSGKNELVRKKCWKF